MSLLAALSNGTLPLVQQQLIRYGYSTYLIFGVSGCCLNILLLSRRQFQTSSCCTYFQAMSVIALIHIVIALGLYLYTLDHVDPLGMNLVICKIRFYILQSTAMMYRWCLTIACFDRFALSSINVNLRNFAKVKIARRVLIIIILVWLVLSIHVPIFYNIRNNLCSIYYNIIPALYHSIFIAVGGGFLPMTIMATCTLLIHRNLALKRQRRQQNVPIGSEVEKLQSKRDQQVLIMLFVQMMFYGITITPLMIMYFYNAITIYLSKQLDRIIVERFLFFLSEMINFLFPVCSFYLYTMVSHMFRVELKAMLRCLLKCRWSENTTRVAPTTQEMRVRVVPERLATLIPIPQTDEFNPNKLESATNDSEHARNVVPNERQ